MSHELWGALAVVSVLAGSAASEDAPVEPPAEATAPPVESTPAPVPCGWCVHYPVSMAPEPDLFSSGTPFKLVDLRYHVSETDSLAAQHEFGARVRVRDWGYLGAAFAGNQRTATLQTHRLDLRVSEDNSQWDLAGEYRTPRFIFDADAQRRPTPVSTTVGAGWLLSPSLGFRATRDLELFVEAKGDTATPYDHFLRSEAASFLWQPGRRFQASGGYEHARDANETAFENTRNTGTLELVSQTGPAELSFAGRLDRVTGRFPRTTSDDTLGVRLPVTSRLLLEGSAFTRFESNLLAHEYRGAATWYGRRFFLPRTGLAAERSVALARHATELGENERKFYGDDERRAQRERLSLSPQGRELAREMAEEYQAQVQERPVPLLGFEFADREDVTAGTRGQTYHVLIGVPWPLAFPWQTVDGAVPFLRLDLTRERRISGPDFLAIRERVELTGALNREMDLVLRWTRNEPTPLEIIRGHAVEKTLELQYVYAFGR